MNKKLLAAAVSILLPNGLAESTCFAQTRMTWAIPFQTESTRVVSPAPGGYTVRNGATGVVTGTYAAPDDAIEQAIEQTDALGGGLVSLREGTYPFESVVSLSSRNAVTIEGSEGCILTTAVSATTTMFSVTGSTSDVTFRELVFQACDGICINVLSGSGIRILDCRFRDVLSSAIQANIQPPADPVLDLWIVGNEVTRACRADPTRRAVFVYNTRNLLFQDNLVQDCYTALSVNIQRTSEDVVIVGNVIRGSGTDPEGSNHKSSNGLYVGGCTRVLVQGNSLLENSGNGFEAASGDGGEANGRAFVIVGNVFEGNAWLTDGDGSTNVYGAGLFITGKHQNVTGNTMRSNGGSGIKIGYVEDASHILIGSNVVCNNGQGGNSGYHWSAGITLNNIGLGSLQDQHILIHDNLIFDDQIAPTQTTGIYCNLDPDGITILDNVLFGHPSPAIIYAPTAAEMFVRGNRGFATEAHGRVTDTTGGTSGTVTLDLAPDLDLDDIGVDLAVEELQVTPLAPTTVGTVTQLDFWVEQTGSTTFAIHWTCDASVTEMPFAWRYGR